jgi:hypothetical protein
VHATEFKQVQAHNFICRHRLASSVWIMNDAMARRICRFGVARAQMSGLERKWAFHLALARRNWPGKFGRKD